MFSLILVIIGINTDIFIVEIRNNLFKIILTQRRKDFLLIFFTNNDMSFIYIKKYLISFSIEFINKFFSYIFQL